MYLSHTRMHAHTHTHTIHTVSLVPSDPLLIYEKALEGDEGFEGALEHYPSSFNPKKIQPEFSG